MEIKEIDIKDLIFDNKNANKGTDKSGKHAKSIKELGLGRGTLADKNLVMIAGNKTLERAIEQGYKKVVVVPTNGDTLVVTQRMDVDINSKKGRELAISDNSIAKEGIEFDLSVLDDLKLEFPDIDDDFMPNMDLSIYSYENEYSNNGGGVNVSESEQGDSFSLKDGDKEPFQQMTFTFADEQATIIKNAIADMKQSDEYKYAETMGNENSNGNALYLIVASWAGQRI